MSSVTPCAFCGCENEPGSRFCMDCGKPVAASAANAGRPAGAAPARPSGPVVVGAPAAARPAAASPVVLPAAPVAAAVGAASARCPRCARAVDARLPFCAHCGAAVAGQGAAGASCAACGAPFEPGTDLFCSRCGHRVGQRVSVERMGGATQVLGARSRERGPQLSLLDDHGVVKASYTLDRGEAVIGRGDADIRLDDVYLSPMHARIELREGELWVRDLGSRNGTWTFIEEPTRLADGDTVLVGSQILRFRRLGYPAPHPPDADSTRRMGSLTPSADIAVLEQLRADGSVRDCFHLSPARDVLIGRESGDWLFPYDLTMSGRHAEVRSQDADFYVRDAGSRNGVALAVRGERTVREGQRILLGDQVLRIEGI